VKAQLNKGIRRIEDPIFVAIGPDHICYGAMTPRAAGDCHEFIQQGDTIYRVDHRFLVRYLNEKVPTDVLAQLELAVTEVLA
jgi:hypothetical protein